MATKKRKPKKREPKTYQQMVRITEQERDKLAKLAEEREMSVSALIRLTLRGAGLL